MNQPAPASESSPDRLRSSSILLATTVCVLLLAAAVYALRHPQSIDQQQPISLGYRVDVNHADAATLELLPGIGPSIARYIVEHRQELGQFRTVADMERVPRIGRITAARLAPWIHFGNDTSAIAQPAAPVSHSEPAVTAAAGVSDDG